MNAQPCTRSDLNERTAKDGEGAPSDACSSRKREGDPTTLDAAPSFLRRIESIPISCTSAMSSVNSFTALPFSASYFKLLESRKQLPVYGQLEEIRRTVQQNSVTIIVGETGSGKTTQIPPALARMFFEETSHEMEEGKAKMAVGGVSSSSLSSSRASPVSLVCCTQPRRIAALSVASRVADEQDVLLGEEVGYHVRFQPKMNPLKTKVLYMTDGLLLRECLSDPTLRRMRAVVVDEVHERTKSTDVVLGLLKGIAAQRSEFRLVVMSATLDVHKLTSYFPTAPLLSISGRLYPVKVHYAPSPVSDYVMEAAQTALRLHLSEPEGDILCFLTGEKEIMQAVQHTKRALLSQGWYVVGDSRDDSLLSRSGRTSSPSSPSSTSVTDVVVLPLYGALSLPDQRKVFARYPAGTRKIIFCTNIAETSVTVDGVVYVIDSGYQKQTLYHANARVEYLLPAVISKASAEQRRGRAGRTREGWCYRLVTEKDYERFPPQSYPEVLCRSVVDIVLLLLEVGVDNPLQFDFIDPPSEDSLSDALFQLLLYGMVDDALQLTPLGKQMAAFPVDMKAARMLVKSASHGCTADVTALVAMGEGGGTVFRGGSHSAGQGGGSVSTFSRPEGDHFSDFFVFHEVLQHQKSESFCDASGIRLQTMHMVYQVYDQLREVLRKLNIPFLSTFREGREGQKESTLNVDAVRKALLEGYFLQVAYLISAEEKRYRTVCDGLSVRLHPHSILCQPRVYEPTGKAHSNLSYHPGQDGTPTWLPQWVLYDRLEVQKEDGIILMRRVTEIDVMWLFEVSEYYRVGGDIEDRDIAFALQEARKRYVASR